MSSRAHDHLDHPRRRRRAGVALGVITALSASSLLVTPAAQAAEEVSTLTAFDAVDQFIGTQMNDANNTRGNDHYGNTYPGATVPFGMVQSSPTTFESGNGQQYGGYEYDADQIRGFGMTRLSGTGCRSNYGGFDFPVIPFTGALVDGTLPSNPASSIGDYFLDFTHAAEDAEPGYYSVDLEGVQAELTSTTRTAVSRYSFDENGDATLLFEAGGSNNQVHASDISYDPATGELSGSVTANIVCNGGSQYTAYFSATFDQPVDSYGTWTPAGVQAGGTSADAAAKHGAGAYLTFADGADVTAKIGLSYVSVEGARANATAEAAALDFDQTRAQARATWEEALGSIDATGGTDRDRITFYTSLYHSLLHPNTFQDVDGTYTGYDGALHQVEPGRDFYVNFSGWDSYRGQSQLVALLYPERASDINQSIVDMVSQSGRWTSWPTYNRIQTKMSGDSLQNIVAATDDFGSTDYDRASALETMIETQTLPMTNTGRSDGVMYGIHGWVDGDKQGAATSRTLEYATNDFAIAQLAQRLGDTAAYERFSTRSQNWKNVFNTTTGHIDARNRNGFLNTSLTTQGAQFEQSTGYQYGFNVSHNMAELIEARGGVDAATTQLDRILRDLDAGAFSDAAYIANQPSFGLPWVYNWLQAPHKTTETLYRAADELFTTASDGLAGNDDLGSFSAWYVWANIGLMPAIWGTADLLVSAPMFEHIEITSIGSDRRITIDAPGAGDDRRYTTGLSVNGTAQTASWLPAEFARTGGTLDFEMSAAPGSWGTDAGDVPPSFTEGGDARNSVGITSDGAVNMGGLDAGGIGLSREDLAAAGVTGGSRIPLGDTGVEFTWPDTAAGQADHWIPNGQELAFGDVAASGISFLGLATNGPSRGTAFVTYSDGTTKKVDVRFTDWTSGNTEAGNHRLVPLTKRNTLSGGSDTAKPTLFATAVVPLDTTKTVRSVTLPDDVNKGIMHVFDVALRPLDTAAPGPGLPTRPAAQEPTAATIKAPTEIDGTAVVDAATTWRFHDTEDDLAAGLAAKTDWTAADYDDSSWKTGTGGFGAKSGAIADLGGGYTPTTLVTQYKAGGSTNIETFFFRTTFDLDADDLAQITQLNGELAYDDAARVYVNGQLVGGFADERVDEATGNMVYAGGNGAAPLSGAFTVPASVLQAGTNTLAVQVHNTNAGSSDVFMQLKSLTIAATGAPAALSDVLLHVGADETQRNLTFYTDREVPAQVQVAPASARTGAEFPASDARVIDATTAQARDGRFSNQVVIDGLQPETSYLYRVGNAEMGWSRSYELWTGTFDESYSFVYLTDAQIGASGSWQNDRDRWAASLDQIDQFEKDASMIVSGGDQIETHRSEDEYGSLIAPELLKQLPFQATIGNHDNQSDQFNSHFFTPNRSETHGYESTAGRAGGDYWYTYNGVLYLNLNTNARSADEEDHAAFLRDVVAEQGGEANWIVVVMHHSLYSAAFHSVEQDVIERRAALAPVFSELGVDLVLAGHDHIYTRSYLMDGTTPVGDRAAQEESGVTLAAEEGQVLYVTGNSSSGSKFYGLDASSPEAAIKDQSNQPQYTDVDVTPESLTLTTYQTMDRTVIDEVTLTRTVDDGEAPQFSGFEPGVEVEVAQGQPFDPLAGVTATDEVDGDRTSAITVSGVVDVTAPGRYTLTYRVADLAGNEAMAERTVIVTAVAPTFGGVPPTRTVVEGEEFDELAGVTATDANGVDITDRITAELVKASATARMVGPAAGAYTIEYTVTDEFGTTATASSAVTVVPAADPTDPGTGPTDPTDPGTDPTDPGTDPTDPGTDPTDPTDPGTDPTDPGTDPTDPTDPGTDPTDPGTDPTDPGTDPGTDPTDPGTEPTNPGTEPTNPGTDPTDPGTGAGSGGDASDTAGPGTDAASDDALAVTGGEATLLWMLGILALIAGTGLVVRRRAVHAED
ncbi:GH92 family glycosyl hydrolase [Microbacterium sp. 1.5R]|uniref:GH92 family glycosyl hydrolase n=1 Tax=Microbacterium sp. 1.5R TaxID=1916917 RepID=UPI0011A818B0|nr:GH92 family glycosyl hydrolase [Microbacterium sp. 1.5R]